MSYIVSYFEVPNTQKLTECLYFNWFFEDGGWGRN